MTDCYQMRSTTAAAGSDCKNAADELYQPRKSFSSPGSAWIVFLLVISLFGAIAEPGHAAGSLSGSFTAIPRGTIINLTAAGPVDWVHWGLYTDTSVDRKAVVTPQISDFKVLFNGGDSNAYAYAYQYSDNYNGYSWTDGTPTGTVTNTTTGVWAYGLPPLDTGFEITAPADTTVRTLKVYVGTFAARGKLSASLSDGSAPDYINSSLFNLLNGPGGVYTIDYSAGSARQQLIVRWTLLSFDRPSGNVTLQAAALTGNAANNPPFVSITAPAENATYNAGDNILITADASDLDGTLTKVEFYENGTKLGETTTSPYNFTWTKAPAGYHVLTAVATDNNADFSSSMPVEIFINGTGGSLSGSVALPPDNLDLSAEGTADWAHWGLMTNSSFDHKAGVVQQISDLTILGTNELQQYSDNLTAYSWSDGTPTFSATNSTTGVFIFGVTNGFQIRAPADTTLRRLKVYVGLYGAKGNFQAYLSDFSGQAFTDTSLDNVFDNSYAVYTLDYAAASSGQTLIIQYKALTLYDFDFGNVTLQAATLVGTNSVLPNNPPAVAITSPTNGASFYAPAAISIMANASDSDGMVKMVEFFQGSTKLGERTNSPYTFVWSNVVSGAYSLTARATDNLGATATSASVDIAVIVSTNTLPELRLNYVLFSANGGLGLSVYPSIAQPYSLEASSTLTNWTSIFTNQTGDAISNFSQAPISSTPLRFFRGKRWP